MNIADFAMQKNVPVEHLLIASLLEAVADYADPQLNSDHVNTMRTARALLRYTDALLQQIPASSESSMEEVGSTSGTDTKVRFDRDYTDNGFVVSFNARPGESDDVRLKRIWVSPFVHEVVQEALYYTDLHQNGPFLSHHSCGRGMGPPFEAHGWGNSCKLLSIILSWHACENMIAYKR